MYSPGHIPTSPYHHQYSSYIPTSPLSINPTAMTPTAQYFYQKQSSPPAQSIQLSPNTSAYLRQRYGRKTDECEPMSTSPIGMYHHSPKEYLPPFLTGEVSQSSFSRGFSASTPEKRRPVRMSLAETMSRTADKEEKAPAKHGPPTVGLGRVNETSPTPFFSINSTTSAEKDLNVSSGFIPSMTSSVSLNSPQDQIPTVSCWVTVFGFPVTATANVLAYFGYCGTIIESKSVPGSNWIHLQYSNVIEARRALQRSGSLIGGNMMVGVCPCTEETARDGLPPGASEFFRHSPSSSNSSQSVGNLNKENVQPLQSGAGTSTPFNPTTQATGAASSTAQNKLLRSRMRPMGRDSLDTQLPQPKSGFVSWALDTIFGW